MRDLGLVHINLYIEVGRYKKYDSKLRKYVNTPTCKKEHVQNAKTK